MLLGMAAVTVVSCQRSSTEPGEPKRLHIVTTIFPLELIVRELVGTNADISTLLPPGASLSGYELSTGDLRVISEADLVVRAGPDVDPWLDRVPERQRSEARLLSMFPSGDEDDNNSSGSGEEDDQAMNALSGEKGHQSRREHTIPKHHPGPEALRKSIEAPRDGKAGNDEQSSDSSGFVNSDHPEDDIGTDRQGAPDEGSGPAPDSYAWLDPIFVAESFLPRMVSELTDLAPHFRGTFATRKNRVHSKLRELNEKIRTTFADAPTRKFVTPNGAWSGFADRYELVQLAPVESDAGGELGPKDIADLIGRARAAQVPTILIEPYTKPAIAAAIASDFGAEPTVIDPLGTPTDIDRSSYVGLMKFNTIRFAEALGAERP